MSDIKLLEDISPARRWEMETTKHALDELFGQVRHYKTGKSYAELLKFVSHFHFYSPYNGMLIHIQMPGATFVAPSHRWLHDYNRIIKTDSRPLVILQPMGPVMFVFDVADTECAPGLEPIHLPKEVEKHFEIRHGNLGWELEKTIENAKRDGIRIIKQKQGSQSAGSIQKINNKNLSVTFRTGKDKDGNSVYINIPVRYDLLINENMSKEAQYTTVIHELGHLYCGHLGTPNEKWWPDRRGLSQVTREFEAESISYLICKRMGIDTPSDEYLSSYLGKDPDIPDISLECIMKTIGLIEQMGKRLLGLRKQTSDSEEQSRKQAKSPSPKQTSLQLKSTGESLALSIKRETLTLQKPRKVTRINIS
jgi:Zn-dependent peptidase ImmA (M78 family)